MSHLTREDFLDYIRAFNLKDYKAQHAFYADNVTLTIPDPAVGTLCGSAQILDHYRPVHDAAEETVIPMEVLIDEAQNKVFFMMETYFEYKKSVKGVHDFKVEAGDVIKVTVWAYYENEGKKMKKIVCNLFEDQCLGKINAIEYKRESESRANPNVRIYHF